MAFCPECGKAVTGEAGTCAACGKQLGDDGKKGRPARFNGTMIMASPLRVAAEQPANANADVSDLSAQNEAAAAAGGTAPRLSMPGAARRSNRPPRQQPAARQRSNPPPATAKATILGVSATAQSTPQNTPQTKAKNLNATMIGAALAPTTPRSKPPVTSGQKTKPRQTDPSALKPGGARPSGKPLTPATTTPSLSPGAPAQPSVRAVKNLMVAPKGAEPAPAAQQQATPAAALRQDVIPEVVASVVDDRVDPRGGSRSPVHPEYLPGDPMAPQPSASERAARAARATHRIDPEESQAGYDSNYVALYWAICVAVALAVGALAFRLF